MSMMENVMNLLNAAAIGGHDVDMESLGVEDLHVFVGGVRMYLPCATPGEAIAGMRMKFLPLAGDKTLSVHALFVPATAKVLANGLYKTITDPPGGMRLVDDPGFFPRKEPNRG